LLRHSRNKIHDGKPRDISCSHQGYAIKLANASGIEVKDIGYSLSYIIGYDTKPPAIIKYLYAALTIIPLVTLRNRAILDESLSGIFVSLFICGNECGVVFRLVSGGRDD
jgi:hypothetical protein